MADFTTVTEEGWLQRLGSSIKGVLIGIVMLLGGVGLLFWNEGRMVKRAKTLKEGSGMVVSVAADQINQANDGKLVHITGEATTGQVLRDPMFGIEDNALKLRRRVEMYQWVEHEERKTKKKTGGGTRTETTYSYDTEWQSREIDSSSFEKQEGHQNPSFPFPGEEWVADEITLGAYTLAPSFTAQLSRDEAVAVGEGDLAGVSNQVGKLQIDQGRFYRGGNPQSPQVGDVRVSFAVVKPAVVSAIGAQQQSSVLGVFTTSTGEINLLEYGTKSAPEMFKAAEEANKMLAWILRAVGIIVLFIGFAAIFKPLSVLADVLPFVGNLVEMGTGLVAFVLALMVGLATIAVGWIFYRPLIGIPLLLAVVALLVWIIRKARSGGGTAQPVRATPPPPPPPPPVPGA